MTGPGQAEQLALLLALQRELALETDIDVVLRRIAEFAVGLLDAERATVYVVDRGGYTLRRIAIDTGQVTTIAGSAGVSALGEAPTR